MKLSYWFCDVLEDRFFFFLNFLKTIDLLITLFAKSYKTMFEHDEGSHKLSDIQKS